MPEPIRLVPHGCKLDVRLDPASLPPELAPPSGQGPDVEIALGAGFGPGMVIRARLNTKSVRRVLKAIAEAGPANCGVSLSGTLKPPASEGAPWTLEGAGIQAFVKAPKPASEGQAQ